MPDVLRVGVLGAGTVGREVVRAFLESPGALVVDGGSRLELAAVAVRDTDRAAASGIPPDLLTDAPAHVVASPGVDVVVELIGGGEPARTLIDAALGAGKPVVSANKHAIAHHGPALEAAARRSGAAFRFEAAVGGGIPVLRPLAGDLAANCVERIRGIVNGTTNYILTAMARDGRAYDDVLADAQAAGYAESDPTADVEGIDASNKVAILARLAFGRWLDPDAIDRTPAGLRGIERPGITGVTAAEIEGAAALGLALKLVADASRDADGRIRASVLPTAVPVDDPLARVSGVTNRIEVRATPIGSVAFTGPGAGGPATASAVLADLRAIARGEGSTWAGLPPADGLDRPLGPVVEGPGRGWFFVVPDSAEAAVRGLPDGDVAHVEGGVAAHARDRSLAEIRGAVEEAIRDVGSRPAVTIYPVDERVR